MKKIDLENHYLIPAAIDAFTARTKPPYFDPKTKFIVATEHSRNPIVIVYDKLLDIADLRIAQMDKYGIDTAVLSCSAGVEQLDEDVSIDICRRSNDAVYEAIQKYPGRFLGSAILPVANADAACKELERCVKELGFVSWHTHSNYGDTYPDNPRYREIFKKAADLNAYVYLHPNVSTMPQLEEFGFAITGATLGFTLDTVISICRLIFLGVFDEIPNLTAMLGHLGETLPFLLERMDNRYELLKMSGNKSLKNEFAPSHYFRTGRILVTTSGNMSKEAFQCTKDVLGIDHILFGSDYPYEPFGDITEFLDTVPLTAIERDKLFFKNAEKLLNRKFED